MPSLTNLSSLLLLVLPLVLLLVVVVKQVHVQAYIPEHAPAEDPLMRHIPNYHFKMLNDHPRNEVFIYAITYICVVCCVFGVACNNNDAIECVQMPY